MTTCRTCLAGRLLDIAASACLDHQSASYLREAARLLPRGCVHAQHAGDACTICGRDTDRRQVCLNPAHVSCGLCGAKLDAWIESGGGELAALVRAETEDGR